MNCSVTKILNDSPPSPLLHMQYENNSDNNKIEMQIIIMDQHCREIVIQFSEKIRGMNASYINK